MSTVGSDEHKESLEHLLATDQAILEEEDKLSLAKQAVKESRARLKERKAARKAIILASKRLWLRVAHDFVCSCSSSSESEANATEACSRYAAVCRALLKV